MLAKETPMLYHFYQNMHERDLRIWFPDEAGVPRFFSQKDGTYIQGVRSLVPSQQSLSYPLSRISGCIWIRITFLFVKPVEHLRSMGRSTPASTSSNQRGCSMMWHGSPPSSIHLFSFSCVKVLVQSTGSH